MLRTIRIHDQHWEAAPRARRDDWRTTIVDLLDDGGIGERHESLVIQASGEAVVLTLDGDDGELRFTIDAARVSPLVAEYLHVIRRMQAEEVAESSAKMQALDMAKRVVHDKGARVIAAAAPQLAAAHETYRRLFTLVLSVLVDVTALPGAAAHRRHVGY